MTRKLQPLELDWYASGLKTAFAHDSYYSLGCCDYYFDTKYKFAISDNSISHEYLNDELDDDNQDTLDYIEKHPERFLKIESVGHIGKHELLKKFLEDVPEKIRNCYYNSIGGWLDCIEEIGEDRDYWKFAFAGYVEGTCEEIAPDFFKKHGYKLIVKDSKIEIFAGVLCPAQSTGLENYSICERRLPRTSLKSMVISSL